MIELVASWHSKRSLPAEMNDGVNMTEQTYIPANIQIEQLIAAGIRLDDYRKELYDFSQDAEIDWDYQDPTRNPGYDPADASETLKQLAKRTKERMRAEKMALLESEAAVAALSTKVDAGGGPPASPEK